MQVLSESVSKAIELTGGPDAKETSIFCDMFDKFFDCLNVRDYNSGKLQRKPFLNPYHSATDFRLQVCIFIHFCTEYYNNYNIIIVVRKCVLDIP